MLLHAHTKNRQFCCSLLSFERRSALGDLADVSTRAGSTGIGDDQSVNSRPQDSRLWQGDAVASRRKCQHSVSCQARDDPSDPVLTFMPNIVNIGFIHKFRFQVTTDCFMPTRQSSGEMAKMQLIDITFTWINNYDD